MAGPSRVHKSSGGAYERRGSFFMRITVAKGVRRGVLLPWLSAAEAHRVAPCDCAACSAANERAHAVQDLVNRLRGAGHEDFVEKFVERAAVADGEKLAALARVVDGLIGGQLRPRASGALTFQTFAERWTSGALHREYPDHVRQKRSVDDDVERLTKHVYPLIGERALDAVSLDDALTVMRKLPEGLAPATRRHVAQLLSRTMALAVYPCRLIPASPLPRGFLPKLQRSKAKSALYPDEDATLLGCTDVPLVSRVLYGFLAREGMRSSEALAMTWGELDLERGVVRLDKNKTDDPRAWALDDGTAEALRRWRAMHDPEPIDTALVFDRIEDRGHLAHAFRAHLETAKVTRRELFIASTARSKVRLHDLRATFVTVGLAGGKSEAWVTARTGHRSSGQVAGYRRLAQTFADVGAQSFTSMAEAIPELRKAAAKVAADPDDPKRRPAKVAKIARRAGKKRERMALGSAAERRGGSSPFSCTINDLDPDRGSEGSDHVPAFDTANAGTESPRAKLIADLADAVRAAAVVGDVAAMRVATRALDELVCGGGGAGAKVVDLIARKRRGAP